LLTVYYSFTDIIMSRSFGNSRD